MIKQKILAKKIIQLQSDCINSRKFPIIFCRRSICNKFNTLFCLLFIGYGLNFSYFEFIKFSLHQVYDFSLGLYYVNQ